MAELGGFFAVSYVAERLFARALDIAWLLRWRDARGAMSYAVPTSSGQLNASGGFSLDKPVLAFVGAVNAVRLSVSAAARLDLQLDQVRIGGVFLEATVTVDVPVVVVHDSVWKKATVDLSQFVLTPRQLRLTWFEGPFDARASDVVLSDASRARLTDELRRRAHPYLTLTFPTDLVYAAETAGITAGRPPGTLILPRANLGGVRVLDGWLAIGIDDTALVSTHGDLSAIGAPPLEVLGGRNVILVADSAIVQRYLNLNAKVAIKLAAALHPKVHPSGDPTVLLHDNLVELKSVGQIDMPDPFSGQFSYNATVQIAPRVSYWDVLATVSPDVSIDPSFFQMVAFALGVLKNLFFGGDVFAKLRQLNEGQVITLFKSRYEAPVPGMSGMIAEINVEHIVLNPDFVAIYAIADTFVRRQTSEGTSYEVDDPPPSEVSLLFEPAGVHIRKRFIQLRLAKLNPPLHRFSAVLLLADPTYLIRYHIVCRGRILVHGKTWSGGTPAMGEAVDLWDPANYLENLFSAELIVERPPGRELVRAQKDIKVIDLFDRAHPYARWWKPHLAFDKEGHSKIVVRVSAVHKTGIHERCKFADAGTGVHARGPYTVQPLDVIPAPETPPFSSKLCPYCFDEARNKKTRMDQNSEATSAPHSRARSFVYAVGRIEPRFPSLAVEKEFAQAVGRVETKGKTDCETMHAVLSARENRYLARQLCYVLTVQGLETYIVMPHDSADFDLLVETVRAVPGPSDLDVVIGILGPIAPAEMCNGLMVPIVAFDQIYSFDRNALIKAIPRPEQVAAKEFGSAAEELFDRIVQMTDNAGATDENRALNYLAVRYPAIYATAAEAFGRSFSLMALNVRPSSLSGVRKIVDCIWTFTHRQYDVSERFFCRVDVTEEFPFRITNMSPYYEQST